MAFAAAAAQKGEPDDGLVVVLVAEREQRPQAGPEGGHPLGAGTRRLDVPQLPCDHPVEGRLQQPVPAGEVVLDGPRGHGRGAGHVAGC